MAAGALVCWGVAAAIEPWRRGLDARGRSPGPGERRSGGVLRPIRLVLGKRPLRRLAAASAVFSMTQFVFTAFFATYPVERAAFSSQAAGGLLSLSLAVSAGARLLWGWLADRVPPALVLGGLSSITAMAYTALLLVSADPPTWAVALVGLGLGATVVAWNGVGLAELAALSPPGQVAAVTAGAMVCIYCGGLVGPAGFAALLAATGGYEAGFAVLAALALGSGAMLDLAH
jgi:predicted MFS family arabinose efflux permease